MSGGTKNIINTLLELAKVRITFAVTITTAVGYILQKGSVDWDILVLLLGTFILACGSAALNHVQEREFDSLMERTSDRPLVAGRMSAGEALAFALSLVFIGLGLLFFGTNEETFLLGLVALAWYNMLYTPLKRYSAMAVVPGAFIGSIPPAMGWVAAGGSVMDPQIWAIAIFVFIWQIPHFWLLLLMYDDEYREAGYPTLTDSLNHGQLSRVTFMWIVALVGSVMIIPLFGITQLTGVAILILVAGIRLIWKTKIILDKYSLLSYRMAFREINYFVLLVMIAVSTERLIINI